MTDSPAALIRRAAALMRKRASEATPGPWEAGASMGGATVEQSAGDCADVIGSEVKCGSYCYGGTAVLPARADAEHIASWHPLVALAVAGWLEDAADSAEGYLGEGLPEYPGLYCGRCFCNWPKSCDCWNRPLAVARAYLNETDETTATAGKGN